MNLGVKLRFFSAISGLVLFGLHAVDEPFPSLLPPPIIRRNNSLVAVLLLLVFCTIKCCAGCCWPPTVVENGAWKLKKKMKIPAQKIVKIQHLRTEGIIVNRGFGCWNLWKCSGFSNVSAQNFWMEFLRAFNLGKIFIRISKSLTHLKTWAQTYKLVEFTKIGCQQIFVFFTQVSPWVTAFSCQLPYPHVL